MAELPKEFRRIEDALLDQGWTFRRTKKGVYCVPPDSTKKMVMWHGTPSDRRARENFIAELRRQGFEPPA